MQTVIEKKLVAVEKKLAALDGLGNEIKRLEKQVADLSKKIESPKDWRKMVGRLSDNKITREAIALGAEMRKEQTQP